MEVSSVEAHKEIMRFIVKSNDDHNYGAYTHLLTDDFVGYNHFVPEGLHGKESLGQFFGSLEVAFPNGKHTIHHLVGSGDLVTMVMSYLGKFEGPLPIGAQPNGKDVPFNYNIMCKFIDGKLAELRWYPFDSLKLMQDLSLIPAL